MKLKTLLLTTLTVCLIPTFAQAKGGENGQRKGPPTPEEMAAHFAKVDTNGDEQLSLEEVQTAEDKRLIKNFAKIDSNSDGLLTKDELEAAHAKRGGKGPKGPKADA
ncbi:hypothetical protein ACWPKO_10355 [Coraliomargarita sp. W4R53]